MMRPISQFNIEEYLLMDFCRTPLLIALPWTLSSSAPTTSTTT